MNKTLLNISPGEFRFKAMIGTGGIGSGSLFLLDGNQTLGREESRSGKYLDARDYCKLHIIAHNVKMLAGPAFPVFPVGMIGDDDVGGTIFKEMEQAGLEMKYVQYSRGDKTLFGFCFLYPDGSGGNLTTQESACSRVDPLFIDTARPVLEKYTGNFVSLAAPEVSLAARTRLLELTNEYNGFSVASFTSGELAGTEATGMLAMVDLLAVNMEEAAALTGLDAEVDQPEWIVECTINKMKTFNPSAMLSITYGKDGSWSWDSQSLSHAPIIPVNVKSTAGAGDAHISGVIAGLAAGLSLPQAQILGNLTGAFSVTSQHTIHPGLNRKNLAELAVKFKEKLDPVVIDLINNPY